MTISLRDHLVDVLEAKTILEGIGTTGFNDTKANRRRLVRLADRLEKVVGPVFLMLTEEDGDRVRSASAMQGGGP